MLAAVPVLISAVGNYLMGSGPASASTLRLPLVYNSAYNIRFLGIEKLHSFDSCKYEKIVRELSEQFHLSAASFFEVDRPVTREELLDVHSPTYLDSLEDPRNVAAVCELPPLAYLPRFIVNSRVMVPNKLQVRGTIVAGELAWQYGWAINIGGGMHHASWNGGGGWCIFSDIFLSFRNLKRTRPALKAMIIDLDVHQGNGLGRDKAKYHSDKDVFIFDAYNPDIYPGDQMAAMMINRHVAVTPASTDDSYIAEITTQIAASMATFKPDIIYYNAGTDILVGDPLNGGVRISANGIRRRDEAVFEAALTNKIPIVMVLSGGYARNNAHVVAASLTNIIRKFDLIERVKAFATV